MKKSGGFPQMLSQHFTECLPVSKGLSGNTIKSCKYSFRLLFEFLKKKKNPA
jgi:hypothetical protein